MTEVACAGQSALFDSEDPIDHAEARQLCLRCPMLDWCREELRKAQADAWYEPYGPAGTWAGLYLYKGEARDLSTLPTGRRAPRQRVARCGTPSGYRKHLRLKEPTCEACRIAVAQDRKARMTRVAS